MKFYPHMDHTDFNRLLVKIQFQGSKQLPSKNTLTQIELMYITIERARSSLPKALFFKNALSKTKEYIHNLGNSVKKTFFRDQHNKNKSP